MNGFRQVKDLPHVGVAEPGRRGVRAPSFEERNARRVCLPENRKSRKDHLHVHARIEQIGHTEFGEIRSVLQQENYLLSPQDDVSVYIDPKSMVFLEGMTLDWQDSLMQSGFVFENPHAKKSCGCGTSFTA